MGKKKGHLIALICIILWSSTVIVTKILLETLQPMDILFWRFLSGYLLLSILHPKPYKTANWKHEIFFFVCGLSGVNLHYMFQNFALTTTRPSDVSIIVCISPIITAIAAKFLDKSTKLTPRFFAGLVVAITGVVFVCSSGNASGTGLFGDFLALLAAFAWSVYCLVSKQVDNMGYTGLLGITRRYFFYGVVTMFPIYLYKKPAAISTLAHGLNIPMILYMGLFASALTYLLWNMATTMLGVIQTTIYLYLLPVFTIFFSILFLDQKITWKMVLGIILTVGGLLLSSNISFKKKA